MQLPKHLKIGLGTFGAGLFGILFGWVLFPTILKSQLKKEMALSKKTDVRAMWEKIPFALDFKVYIFNYTNYEEVQKGALPIVKEIGPYHFDEWKEKVEVEEHDEDDTITYKKRDYFYFRPDLSGPGLTGEETVVIPHLLMLGIATIVNRDKPAMMNMLGKAFNGIFDEPKHIFLKAKALDLLFGGVIINCQRTEFAPKAVCTALKKEAANGIVFEPNNQYRLSLFGTRNGSIDPHVVTVRRGVKNVMDVGKVIAVDGKTEQNVWKDQCDDYVGTDGTVFPPFLTEKDNLESFSSDLCRSFKPWYQKKTSYRGIKTNRYVANIGDFANEPDKQCFCDTPETCPPKGFMDLTKCLKAPMFASLPHFLDCDPEQQKQVKGLNPDVNEHGIEIDFEPISGTPMVARQRVQFNMILMQADKLELVKDLPNTMAPLFWIEEGLALNKTFVKMLKNQLFLPKRIVGVVRWLLVAVGLAGVVGSAVFHFRGNITNFALAPNSATVTKINPENNQPKDISVIGESQNPPKVDM
uniref:Sensory neuron membrane protein n=1 Tax=Glyphodes pyloalis TaxID=1242752 RepID=A0A6M3GTT4_GLYPY|nr:sensory neuron membrane protein [Glyphodes pyloalis]